MAASPTALSLRHRNTAVRFTNTQVAAVRRHYSQRSRGWGVRTEYVKYFLIQDQALAATCWSQPTWATSTKSPLPEVQEAFHCWQASGRTPKEWTLLPLDLDHWPVTCWSAPRTAAPFEQSAQPVS